MPLITKRAASLPNRLAANSWRRSEVGSSCQLSLPTSASYMALRISTDGLVTKSLRKSITFGNPHVPFDSRTILRLPLSPNSPRCPGAEYADVNPIYHGASQTPEPKARLTLRSSTRSVPIRWNASPNVLSSSFTGTERVTGPAADDRLLVQTLRSRHCATSFGKRARPPEVLNLGE